MKKLFSIKTFMLLLAGITFFAAPVQAFFLTRLLMGPAQLPMPDIPDEVSSTLQTVSKTANQVKKTQNAAQNMINNTRTALNSAYNFEFSALVDGSLNPGQRKISNCTINKKKVDVYDAASVEDAFRFLFFQYPHHTQEIINAYDDSRNRFYLDNLVEIYIESQQLEMDMEERVKPTVSEARECVRNGGCGIPSSDANTESLYGMSKALEAMDNVLLLLQKAEALKAQLAAIKAMKATKPLSYKELPQNAKTADEVIPETKIEDAQEEASLPSAVYASAVVKGGLSLAFAQSGVSTVLSKAENSVAGGDVSQRYLSRMMSVSAPESEIFHPYLDEEEKMAQLDNLQPVEENTNSAMKLHNTIHDLPSYKKAAEAYREAVEKHQKALDALRASEKCALGYIGRHFKNKTQTWSGASLTANPSAHELRQGISAWAIDAFETAKAAKASSASSSDVVLVDIDEDETDLSDISDTKASQAVLDKNKAASAPTSKQEKVLAENREIALISWQIGSEASKMLAAEPEKWGGAPRNFPVWNDVKSFYDQYLDGKYANIKSYLKMYSKEDVAAIVIARLQGSDKAPSETLLSKEVSATNDELSEEYTRLNAEREQSLEQHEAQKKTGLSALYERRKKLQADLDRAHDDVKATSAALSDLRQKIRDDSAEKVRESITEHEYYPDSDEEMQEPQASLRYNSKLFSKMGLAFAKISDAKELKEAYQKNTSAAKSEGRIKELEQQLDAKGQKVTSLEKQLDALDEEIKRYKLTAQERVSAVQERYDSGAASAESSAASKKQQAAKGYAQSVVTNLNSLAEKISKELELEIPLSLSHVLPELGVALDKFYAQVDERIDRARKEIAALGDSLYDPAAHEKITAIHNRLIKDLKVMALEVWNIKGLEAVQAVYLYDKLLSADVSAEAEDYFVGKPAKERDLKAPMQIFTQNLPPLREVVHFDETDFQNVTPYVAGTKAGKAISAQDFLNYGGDIPPVWKRMLRPAAFVEAPMDYHQALNVGCPQEAFYRGGVFPCRVKDSAFVLDINAKGELIKTEAGGKELAYCPFLEARNGKVYHRRHEIFLNIGGASSVIGLSSPAGETVAPNCAYSELGTLLDADKHNNIFFREGTFNAFYSLIESKNNADKELSEKQKKQLAAYENAPLAADQIGDFLQYSENEQALRKSLEEISVEYEQMMDGLKEILRSYGYEPAEKLDLADAETYELIRSKLDNAKSIRISAALEAAEEVEAKDNPVVEERLTRLNAMIAAMQKDKDEQIVINTAIVDDNDIDGELKSSKVNEEVAAKFEKSLNNMEKLLDMPAEPYCPNY